jgi:chromosome segregation ATPase
LPKDDFYTPTDIDALRMENELLAFEVRFLKAQLAEPERLRRQLEEAERSATQLRSRLAEAEAEAERAEQDIVLLLRRLARGPLGLFLGLRQNFRVLEQRYLDTDA